MKGEYIFNNQNFDITDKMINQNTDYQNQDISNIYRTHLLPDFYIQYKTREGDSWDSLKKYFGLTDRADKYVRGLPKDFISSQKIKTGTDLEIPFWFVKEEEKKIERNKQKKQEIEEQGKIDLEFLNRNRSVILDENQSAYITNEETNGLPVRRKYKTPSFFFKPKVAPLNLPELKGSISTFGSPVVYKKLPISYGNFFEFRQLQNNFNYFSPLPIKQQYEKLISGGDYDYSLLFNRERLLERLGYEYAKAKLKKEEENGNTRSDEDKKNFLNEKSAEYIQLHQNAKLYDSPYGVLEKNASKFIYLIVPLLEENNIKVDDFINKVDDFINKSGIQKTHTNLFNDNPEGFGLFITGEVLLAGGVVYFVSTQLAEDNKKLNVDKTSTWDLFPGIINGLIPSEINLTNNAIYYSGKIGAKSTTNWGLSIKLLDQELTGLSLKLNLKNSSGAPLENLTSKQLANHSYSDNTIWYVPSESKYYETLTLREKVQNNEISPDEIVYKVNGNVEEDAKKISEYPILQRKNLQGYPRFDNQTSLNIDFGNHEPTGRFGFRGGLENQFISSINKDLSLGLIIKTSLEKNLFRQGPKSFWNSQNNTRLDRFVFANELQFKGDFKTSENNNFGLNMGGKIEIIPAKKYIEQLASATITISFSQKYKNGDNLSINSGYKYTRLSINPHTVYFKVNYTGKNITLFGTYEPLNNSVSIRAVANINPIKKKPQPKKDLF